ncbi:MAG: DUF177 domain-containing protein [Sphingomonadales bacterium]
MTVGAPEELRRPFDIVALPDGGRAIDIAANEAEREAVAGRLGLLSVSRLTLNGRLDPLQRGRSAVFEARLSAGVIQECIVSGEPVEAVIDETLRVRLLVEDDADEGAELDLVADDDDVEYAEAGIVDLGELGVQYLALALDPYPRAAGAGDVVPGEIDGEGSGSRENPFAVLKKLKDKT